MLMLSEVVLKQNPISLLIEGMEPLDDRIDKLGLANLLIQKCGAITPMYTELTTFWWSHNLWFRINADNINHLCETMYYNYSPIHNYDMDRRTDATGTIHKETASDRNKENSGDYTDSNTANYRSTENEKLGGKDELKHTYASNVEDTGGGTSTNRNERDLTTQVNGESDTEEKVSAYNEDLYQPSKTTHEEHSETTNVSGNVDDNGSYTDENMRKHTGSDTDTTSYGKTKETKISDDVTESVGGGHSEGNESETMTTEADTNTKDIGKEIGFGSTGIYTKQQMIEQERQLAMFNLDEWIIDEYKKDNFLLVY